MAASRGRGEEAGEYSGSLRVPYRVAARYQQMRLEYEQRNDVAWGSDEEALVKDIRKREPKFFDKTTPFIGYVQFLFETQLNGGERMKSIKVNAGWFLGGLHHPPNKPGAGQGAGRALATSRLHDRGEAGRM